MPTFGAGFVPSVAGGAVCGFSFSLPSAVPPLFFGWGSCTFAFFTIRGTNIVAGLLLICQKRTKSLKGYLFASCENREVSSASFLGGLDMTTFRGRPLRTFWLWAIASCTELFLYYNKKRSKEWLVSYPFKICAHLFFKSYICKSL